MTKGKSHNITFASLTWQLIDDWRKQQEAIPTLSKAVETLVLQSLDGEAGKEAEEEET
jgi:hypothetical protein